MTTVGEAFIEIKADTDDLRRTLSRDIDRVLDRIDASIELDIETSTSSLRDAERSISNLDGQIIDVEAILNGSEIDELEMDLSALDGSIIDSAISLESSDVDELATEIASLDGSVIDTIASVDDGDFESFAVDLAAIDGSVLDLNVSVGSGALSSLESSISSLDGRIIDLIVAIDDSALEGVGDDLGAVAASGDAATGALAGVAAASRFAGPIAGVAALAAGVGGLANETVELEVGLAEVASLQVPDFGFDEARELVDELIQQTGVASEEAIPALYGALSAGVPPDTVLDFLIQSQELAIAGVAELEDSVGLLTGATNAYGDALGDPIEASNALFATVQSGVTTLPELGASLGQVTPLAAELGITWEELNAAVATSTQVTQNTAQSVTGLRGLMAELGTATSRAGGNFAEIAGETFPQFIDNGGSLGEALAILADGAEESGLGLNELFGSVEAGGVALQLAREDGAAFADTLANVQDIAEAGVAVETAVEINEETLSIQLSQLSSQFQNLFTNLALDALPVITSIVGGVNDLISSISFDGFGDIFDDLGLDDSSVRVFESFRSVLSSLGGVIGSIDFSNLDLSFFGEIVASVATVWEGFAELVSDFVSENEDTFVAIFEAGIEVFNSLGEVLASIFSLLADNEDTIFAVLGFIGDVLAVIAEVAAFVIPIIASLIALIVELTVDVLGPLINVIGEVIEFFFELGSAILNAVTQVADLPGIIGGFFSALPGIIIAAIGEAAGAATSFGSSLVTGVINALIGLPEQVRAIFRRLINSVVGFLGSALGAARDVGQNILEGILGTITDIPMRARGVLDDIIQAIRDAARDALAAARNFGADIARGIGDGFNSIPGVGFVTGFAGNFFADGGIVDGPTQAIIGEAGAEAVIPLTRPARALQLLRESGLDTLLFENLADRGPSSISSIDTSSSATTNNNIVNNVEIAVGTQEGQDTGLLAESLLTELSSSGSRGLASI